MHEYPNPKEFLHKRVDPAAKEYIDGLKERGMRNNPKLLQAFIDKEVRKARADYQREMDATFAKNVKIISELHKRRDRQLQREGARTALIFCPIAIAMFGGCTWMGISQHNLPITMIYSAGTLIFLVMLIAAVAQLRK